MPLEAALVAHQLPGQPSRPVLLKLLLEEPSPSGSPALAPAAEGPSYPLVGAFFSELKQEAAGSPSLLSWEIMVCLEPRWISSQPVSLGDGQCSGVACHVSAPSAGTGSCSRRCPEGGCCLGKSLSCWAAGDSTHP